MGVVKVFYFLIFFSLSLYGNFCTQLFDSLTYLDSRTFFNDLQSAQNFQDFIEKNSNHLSIVNSSKEEVILSDGRKGDLDKNQIGVFAINGLVRLSSSPTIIKLYYEPRLVDVNYFKTILEGVLLGSLASGPKIKSFGVIEMKPWIKRYYIEEEILFSEDPLSVPYKHFEESFFQRINRLSLLNYLKILVYLVNNRIFPEDFDMYINSKGDLRLIDTDFYYRIKDPSLDLDKISSLITHEAQISLFSESQLEIMLSLLKSSEFEMIPKDIKATLIDVILRALEHKKFLRS